MAGAGNTSMPQSIRNSNTVLPLAIDGQKHLIEIPFVAGSRPAVAEPIGIVLPEFAAPLADSLMRDLDAAFEQQFLYVAIAQAEPVVEPDPMANHFSGKAIVDEAGPSEAMS